MIRMFIDLIKVLFVTMFVVAGHVLWWAAFAITSVTRWLFRLAWNRPKAQIAATNGIEYEHCVAAYLRGKGYTGVQVTQASGDYGVDVLAHKWHIKYAVQCKFYALPVGVDAVQEAVAGKAHYGCNGAMVVTNSTFTKAAETLARENGVLLIPGVSETGDKPVGVFAAWAIALCVLFLSGGVAVAFTEGGVVDGLSVLALVTAPLWLGPVVRCVAWKISDKYHSRVLEKFTHSDRE